MRRLEAKIRPSFLPRLERDHVRTEAKCRGCQVYSPFWSLAGQQPGRGWGAGLARWSWLEGKEETIWVEIALRLAGAPTTLYL